MLDEVCAAQCGVRNVDPFNVAGLIDFAVLPVPGQRCRQGHRARPVTGKSGAWTGPKETA